MITLLSPTQRGALLPTLYSQRSKAQGDRVAPTFSQNTIGLFRAQTQSAASVHST